MPPMNRQNRFRRRPGRSPVPNQQSRVYDSTGPEGKVRGTPQQIAEKYQAYSRDAATAGDHVAAESYLQHAEHYSRMVIGARRLAQQRREERTGDEDTDQDLRSNGAALTEDDSREPDLSDAEHSNSSSNGRQHRYMSRYGDGRPPRYSRSRETSGEEHEEDTGTRSRNWHTSHYKPDLSDD